MNIVRATLWWYASFLPVILHHSKLIALTVIDFFSFSILFKTLFQPWKRDVTPMERLSLQEKLNVFGMNMIARLIGAVVRSSAIFAGIVVLIFFGMLVVFAIVSWAVAPFLSIGLIIWGVVNVFGGLS